MNDSSEHFTASTRKADGRENAGPPEGFVKVKGIEKRLTSLADLNERFALLDAPGSPSVYVSRVDFLPITDMDLKRRLSGEVVPRSTSKYDPAFNFWTGHARRQVYRRVTFTSGKVAPDVYNLYRGLGVKPREGICDRILAHIREVICCGNDADGDAMLKLLAWQIQNIGKPSRTIVCLKSRHHQVGKGLLLEELMLKIYGPSGFSVSQSDQILGRFNDAIRGKAFLFFDEVLFAGDRRSADSLKRLSTATSYGIEAKGLPTIQCPVGVNIWLLSNHDAAAFVEEHDARYWALNVSEHRRGDSEYFAELMAEVENGGREAFAHHLRTTDVSTFVPWRDVPKDNAVRRDLIVLSINPYDARKWIEDCCLARRLIGRKNAAGEWELWEAGDEHAFHRLHNAYVEWQKNVRTRLAPEPTPTAWFGRALTAAGFGAKRKTAGMTRILPDPAECLKLLWESEKPPSPPTMKVKTRTKSHSESS